MMHSASMRGRQSSGVASPRPRFVGAVFATARAVAGRDKGAGSSKASRSVLSQVFEAVVLAFAGSVIVAAAIAVGSGAWQIRPVLSGSMRPGLPIGGVVVTQRIPLADLQVRDVAVFHPPFDSKADYVHRVISLRRDGSTLVVHTQGDDNLYPDPWTLRLHGRYAYVARFAVPLLGYPAVWVHSPTGRRDLLAAGAVLAAAFAGTFALDRRRRRRRSVPAPELSPTGPGV